MSIQLFGEDPAMMRSAAAHVARRGRRRDRHQHGLPGAEGAARPAPARRCSADPDRAVAVARAAVEGARERRARLPVTVKLRSGLRPGETSGFELAHRLVDEAGVAAIAFHPRSAAVQHKGVPDYELAARLVESLPAPVILTGGLERRRAACARRSSRPAPRR